MSAYQNYQQALDSLTKFCDDFSQTNKMVIFLPIQHNDVTYLLEETRLAAYDKWQR